MFDYLWSAVKPLLAAHTQQKIRIFSAGPDQFKALRLIFEDDEIPEPPQREAPAGGRQSVSAEAYGQWNQKKEFTAPVHPKTDAQKTKLPALQGETIHAE